MSKQNKWAGSFGKVASGGSSTKGGNTYNAPKAGPAPRDNSSVKDNVVTMKTGPGDHMGTQTISSHNSINAFTRGIKSRGPYGGPTFASLNHYEKNYQTNDTSKVSKTITPSSPGQVLGDPSSTTKSGKTGGRNSRSDTWAGGTGRGPNDLNVGMGKVKAASVRESNQRSNKTGSGYMAG